MLLKFKTTDEIIFEHLNYNYKVIPASQGFIIKIEMPNSWVTLWEISHHAAEKGEGREQA